MEVSRIRALRGPNLWTRHTAVEAMVTCEAGEIDLSEHPDFEGRLRNLFPGVGNLQPTQHKVKLSMAHALEAATLHLQIEAGCPVTFSRTTATTDHGLFQVAVEYTEEQVGFMAIKLAMSCASLRSTTPALMWMQPFTNCANSTKTFA
jgi:cyanophycin synthetase